MPPPPHPPPAHTPPPYLPPRLLLFLLSIFISVITWKLAPPSFGKINLTEEDEKQVVHTYVCLCICVSVPAPLPPHSAYVCASIGACMCISPCMYMRHPLHVCRSLNGVCVRACVRACMCACVCACVCVCARARMHATGGEMESGKGQKGAPAHSLQQNRAER